MQNSIESNEKLFMATVVSNFESLGVLSLLFLCISLYHDFHLFPWGKLVLNSNCYSMYIASHLVLHLCFVPKFHRTINLLFFTHLDDVILNKTRLGVRFTTKPAFLRRLFFLACLP